MTDNKVVIKINYDKANAKQTQPQMITEWHTARIMITVVLFLIIAGLLIYTFNRDVSKKERVAEKIKQSHLVEPEINVAAIKSERMVQVEEEKEEKQVHSIAESQIISQVVVHENSKIIAQPQIFDKRVSRAMLAEGLDNKEPVGKVSVPIVADKTKAVGVFYFTEINNMKGEVLFHKWFKNDKLVFKRKIKILGNRWRASTRKMLTYSAKGHWLVKLVDESENILSEVDFDVI